jgi:hypothetical protein
MMSANRRVVSALVAAVALATSMTVPAFAAKPDKTLSVPITATGTAADGRVGTFVGDLAITRFVEQGGQVFAIGTLTGQMTQGTTVTSIVNAVSVPVSRAAATAAAGPQALAAPACEILNLVLGPIHLDLLGLVVDLNQVVLNITAQPGAGNLLGNLLCAITGLLDGQTSLLTNLLNQLLGLLSGL